MNFLLGVMQSIKTKKLELHTKMVSEILEYLSKYSKSVCTTEPTYEDEDVEQGMLYEVKESK